MNLIPRARVVLSPVCALALFLEWQAAGQLFSNLRTFGSRLPAGDPQIKATNSLDGPKGIATADFNGDGRPDLAVANTDGTVTIYYALAPDRFSAPVHLQTRAQELRGIIAADLNGDGRPDVAVAAPYSGEVFLFINHGTAFAEASSLTAWAGARNLTAGDFDGDGRQDLVLGGTTNGLRQMRGMAGGVFSTVTNITSLGTVNREFPKPVYVLGAFRPAGATRDELVATHADSDLLWVLSADGSGTLQVAAILTNQNVHAVAVGPITRARTNEVPDLVRASRDYGTVEIHRGTNGPGRFEQAVTQRLDVPGGPRALAVADLDRDGWNDLVVVLRNFDRVLTYHNSNGVLVAASEQPVGKSPREIVSADFNNDGRPDVAVMNRDSSDVSVLFTHPGEAGFSTLDQIYPVDGEVAALSVKDVNNDGRDDVLQLHRASGEVSVRLAGTNGVLGPPKFYGMGVVPSDQSVLDVNGDRIDDIVSANLGRAGTDKGSLVVRLGRGDGTFGSSTNVEIPDDMRDPRFFAIVAADFDNDGHPDLAVGFYDCRIAFFKGNGDGSFTLSSAHEHLFIYEARAMVVGDFDKDGDIDLAGIGYYGGMVVAENQGDLLTTEHLATRNYDIRCCGGDAGATSAKALDYNGDGDLDILVGSQKGTTLYLGGPGMDFILQETPVGAVEFPTSSLVIADLDGDGDDDVAIACKVLSCVSILTRDGDSEYLPSVTVDVPSGGFLATGDLDGDHKPDLVGSGSVLWTALSSRRAQKAPPVTWDLPRSPVPKVLINEFLAINANLPLEADGRRTSDWLEIYNAGATAVPLNGWKLALRTDGTNNEYVFPATAFLAPSNRLVVVCSEIKRTLYHTGFRLPGSGGTLVLLTPGGEESDRVVYPVQQENVSYGRFRDGAAALVSNPYPSPNRPNTDNGPVEPVASIGSFAPFPALPERPIRFRVTGRDDVGMVGVSLVWQRLDIADSELHRLPFYDDGMHSDGGSLDGQFSGLLEPGLAAGAEIQFYLEVTDLSDQTVTLPSEPVFAVAGQPVNLYSLTVGGGPPAALEISEVVAANDNGLRDESGSTPDWVEIRNRSSTPVSLAGVNLAQQFFGDSARYSFPEGDLLRPGEHRVIYCDNKPTNGPNHAPFGLNRAGDTIVLTGLASHGARQVLDEVTFAAQAADRALARLGSGGPWNLQTPTPEAPNVPGSWTGVWSPDRTLFTFVFPTAIGAQYIVEHADSLTSPTWTAWPAMAGNGLEQTVDHAAATSEQFFRVRRVP
jgi:hypothetical protein